MSATKRGCRPVALPFDAVFRDAADPNSKWPDGDASIEDVPIVRSAAARRAWQLAERAAATDFPVLILGSTGVGKEVIARHIHHSSGRKGPFRALNCGAIPENLIEAELFGYKKGAFTGAAADTPGIFEAAAGGTVFLDEIGELPLAQQVKFLRILQERELTRLGEHHPRKLDCRILAATHRDLWQAIEKGDFRADLYYRLAIIFIHLPDLKQRPEDLEAMIHHFWQRIITKAPGFPGRELSDEAQAALMAYSWPGNVRELEAVLMRIAFLAEGPVVKEETIRAAIGLENIHPGPRLRPKEEDVDLPIQGSMKEMLDRYRASLIQRALADANGNKTRAAKQLDITPQHLSRLLKECQRANT